MTSIDKLYNEIKHIIPNDFLDKFEQAKEMHKQEIIDAYYQCGRDNFEHIKVINRSATEYYQETFVSKGKIKFTEEEWAELNNAELPQQEISDEEIEKAVMDSMDYVYLNPNDSLIFHQGWMRAIKWYREQLKCKGNDKKD